MTHSALRPILAATALLVANSFAQAQMTDTLSYSWVGGGYLWSRSGEEAVSDPKGFAVAASFEPVERIVISLSAESAVSKLDPQFGEIDLKGRAIVGTVGTYWPLSERLHLSLAVGVDYERIELTSGVLSASGDLWFANVVAGIAIKANRRWELGASLQRLQALNDTAAGESNWVLRADAAFGISDRLDLITSVAYENDEPGVILGARWRF